MKPESFGDGLMEVRWAVLSGDGRGLVVNAMGEDQSTVMPVRVTNNSSSVTVTCIQCTMLCNNVVRIQIATTYNEVLMQSSDARKSSGNCCNGKTTASLATFIVHCELFNMLTCFSNTVK